jgi:transposase-like protein/uncharacterized ParB-like nuclease family protein/DNA-binding Lrp family transcriptional regulator
MGKTRQHYTQAERDQALQLAAEIGVSKAARQLGINQPTVSNWLAKARSNVENKQTEQEDASWLDWGSSPVDAVVPAAAEEPADNDASNNRGDSPVAVDGVRAEVAVPTEPDPKLNGDAERVVVLPLDNIRVDPNLQVRVDGTDEDIVLSYEGEMLQGAQFPPVDACQDGDGTYWLFSGFHRVAAARRAGHEALQVHVRQGSRRDALLLAVGENATHGLRRTRADIQKAIALLLQDPEWGTWTDRKVAELVGVDHKTVGAQRRRLEETGKLEASDIRVGLDGRTYAVTGASPESETSDPAMKVNIEVALAETARDNANAVIDNSANAAPTSKGDDPADPARADAEATRAKVAPRTQPTATSESTKVTSEADEVEAAVVVLDDWLDGLKTVLEQVGRVHDRLEEAHARELVVLCNAAIGLLTDEVATVQVLVPIQC